MIRKEVARLVSWIPRLSDEFNYDYEALVEFQKDVDAVSPPITAEERESLLPLMLMPEEVHGNGLMWGVLHLFESGPGDGFVRTLPIGGGTWLFPVSRYTRKFPRLRDTKPREEEPEI